MALRTPSYVIIDGQRFPKMFTAEKVRSAKLMKPRPDDVFVCTYAKSGTTWIQHIVYQLLGKNEYDVPSSEKSDISYIMKTLPFASPMIEHVGANRVDGFESPRVLKSHFAYGDIPKGGGAKYIFACRNPKDVLTSFYHHHTNFKMLDFENGDFDVFFDLFMKGEVLIGDYFDHLTSWLQGIEQAQEQILFLKYEDMVADLQSAVVKIANFIGGKAIEMISNEHELAKIVEASTFGSMKNDQHRWAPLQIMNDPSSFIRKGGSRNWKNHFKQEQSERMDARFRDRLASTAAAKWWHDEMAWSGDKSDEFDGQMQSTQ